MILIQFEPGLVIVHSFVPAIALESDVTYLPTILLRSRKTFDVRPESVVDHLKNFGVDQIQLWVLKLQGRNHVLSVIGFELDTILSSIIHLFKKFVMKPCCDYVASSLDAIEASTSIQSLS